jgi:hypothetical protein
MRLAMPAAEYDLHGPSCRPPFHSCTQGGRGHVDGGALNVKVDHDL